MSVVAQVELNFPAFSIQSNKRIGEDYQGLLSGLLGELLTSALFTATTASIANTIASRAWTRSTSQFCCHLPPAPSLFPEARVQLCSSQIVLASQIGEYYDQLNYLRGLSDRLSAKSEIDANIAGLAEAWRALAMPAVAAINELLKQLQEDARKVDQERALIVSDLLMRVAAGETPCIDSYGMVKIPTWANRRIETRMRRGSHAFLQVADSLQCVAVLDAGEYGIGVLGLKNAPVGARVGLLVKPGYAVDGTVTWVDGARAGIELSAPLQSDCPLMTYHS